MLLDALLSRRLWIISGKGGVGKTTLAAALGLVASRNGKRVLVAEVEGKHALAALFGEDALTHTPVRLDQNLYGMSISPDKSLEEYFQDQLHLGRIAKPIVSSQVLDYVTHAAPGLRDVLMLGKVWYEANRKHDYDLIILDTAAAGHAVSMLRSPQGFLHAVPVGPLASQARRIVEWLQDPEKVSILLASLPEEMPVNETIETTQLLEERVGMDVAAILINMLYPPISEDAGVTAKIEGFRSPADLISETPMSDLDAAALYDCSRFYLERRALQQEHRKRLVKTESHTAAMVDIPYLFSAQLGKQELDILAAAIEEQMT